MAETKTWVLEAWSGKQYPSMIYVGCAGLKPFLTDDFAKAILFSSAEYTEADIQNIVNLWAYQFPAPELCYTLRAFEISGITCQNPILVNRRLEKRIIDKNLKEKD